MNQQKIRRLILLISFLLLPVTFFYLSPVLIIEGAASGIVTGSAIIFTFIFLFSLIGGRLWCGWICPFGSLQDLAREVQGKRVTNPWIDRFRYGLFVIWILILLAFFIRAGGITSIESFYQTTNGLSVACVLYTSDAADDPLCVDLDGRRIIHKYIVQLQNFTHSVPST